ncbi:SHOCT domain-containing protein [Microbacteriaceae bacterium VKM Ac-2854]|nr:SHOCT domain-containing protein [Microbacteriaceae bacterium VKM Ac-2854]
MLTIQTLRTGFDGPSIPNPSAPAGFDLMLTLVPIFIVLVIVVMVVLVVMNVRRARQHGLNPLTMQTDLAARFIKNGVGANPDAPLQDRLAELEALKASGTITEREYAQARASALNG